MPDRILRAGIITSERVNKLSWSAEVFYRRLMSIVDDYGRYEFNRSLLRSQLYPLKVDRVSVSDIVKWSVECAEAGLIRLYTIDGKEYIEIIDFNQRLRAMKSKFPAPADICRQMTDDVVKCSGNETKRIGNESEARTSAQAPLPPLYEKTKKGVYEFIKNHSPTSIEPYKDLWNLFAEEYGLVQIKTINESRKRKFKIRVKEPAFDFLKILSKAKGSEFLKASKWFGFDWIIENDSNYLKIIEGNYSDDIQQQTGNSINDALKAAAKA